MKYIYGLPKDGRTTHKSSEKTGKSCIIPIQYFHQNVKIQVKSTNFQPDNRRNWIKMNTKGT